MLGSDLSVGAAAAVAAAVEAKTGRGGVFHCPCWANFLVAASSLDAIAFSGGKEEKKRGRGKREGEYLVREDTFIINVFFQLTGKVTGLKLSSFCQASARINTRVSGPSMS